MCIKRRTLPFFLVLLFVLSMSTTVFANSGTALTEEEVMEQIANNTATVSYEVRPLQSFSQEEIDESPGLQKIFAEVNAPTPYSTNINHADGNVYTVSITTDSGQNVTYTSMPRVTFCVIDVGTAGSSDIYSTFEVIESVEVDGNLNTGWHNAVRYRNVVGTMGCGVNTAFTSDVSLRGNSAGSLGINIMGIIGMLINQAGLSTVSQILSALGNITYSGAMVSNRDITSEFVRAVGAKLDDAELYSDAHNLTVDSSISTIDSGLAANQSTCAAAEWEFDVYYFVGSVSPAHRDVSVSCSENYRVNVK